MKKLLLPALMYILILMATALPVSAQTPNQTEEYKKLLKSIMELSGASSSSQQMMSKFVSNVKQIQPQQDDAYWEKVIAKWTQEIEEKILEVYVPIYQQNLTLDEMKKVLAFYESPLGRKLGKTTLALSNETLGMMQEMGMKMATEIMPQLQVVQEPPTRICIADENRKRDQEIMNGAYTIPSDSIEVAYKTYKQGMSTVPSLYSIERRKKDTKVTFLQPIYFDRQWLYFSPGFKIIDKKTGDEYNVRGYDGGIPSNKLLIVNGFNNKYIYISLVFPKLGKDVKDIDILELPHKNDITLPSNDDGIAKSYYNVKLNNYLVTSPENKKIYD